MNSANPKVDWYFTKHKAWQEEIEALRAIALDSELSEVLKWGCPCYSLDDKNVILIHVFKEYCAILFFKGALMKDPSGLLIQQTANVQAARQMRFTNLDEVIKRKKIIKNYIKEAIAIEKSGAKVPMKKTREFDMPEEFKEKLDKMPKLEKAFKELTPGRQRAYLLFFSSAKQAKTREARIEKNIPRILAGKGIDD
ncbi:MAG: YdeI/OmpD-associated family protein [Bacteroidia bacterium]|nr:YdeI/OmpD-associated family protein [Bacteroidia bacterium]